MGDLIVIGYLITGFLGGFVLGVILGSAPTTISKPKSKKSNE